MYKFKCDRCTAKISSFDILTGYNKYQDSYTCYKCGQEAKLRHFTKDIKISEIRKNRDKIIYIMVLCTIPLQVWAYLNLINYIGGY